MLFQVYSGAGKSLPIWRGGGVNQKLFLDFARLAAAGEWVHIFPEAGCFQHEILGGRYDVGDARETKGRLKWGVGKLIAHAPVRPTVICFYHSGMEHIMPQQEFPRTLKTKTPIPGHDVKLKVGDELDFEDLISEHEAVHGPLWKYDVLNDLEDDEDFHAKWDSKETDYILYHKITARIEDNLLRLGSDMPHFKGVSNIKQLLEAHTSS